MRSDTNGTIKGMLTGNIASYVQGDMNGRMRAIETVEKHETNRQRELESLAGRRLTTIELQRGTIDHPETRSQEELRRLRSTIIKPTPMPENGEDIALAHLERQVEDSKLSIRERQLKLMKERRAARLPEPEPPTPEAIKLMAEAKRFAQSVHFTSGATVEQVERADGLMDVARTGDRDAYQDAVVALADDIKATIFDAPVAIAEANAAALRERVSTFDIQKPKPEPAPEPDTLANDIRKAEQALARAKELV